MAATVDSHKVVIHGGLIEQHTVLSALTDAQTENITVQTSLGAPTKTAPLDVSFEWLATSGDAIQATHVLASDSTSNDTVAVKFDVETSGSVTNAIVRVKIRWLASARQDRQSINADNNT